MKILITGVHGFVGSNLVSFLPIDSTIYGLDIIQVEKKRIVKTYSWDDISNNTLPEVDAIIHLAGKAHDTNNNADKDLYFAINTDLTIKIFNYYLSSSAKSFIFFSSVKAAADSVKGNILTEDVIPQPKGPYGESKIKAEKYLLSQLPILKEKNKKLFILRPCMIYGPGNKGNLNLLYKLATKRLPWPLGAYENRRSFCSIENISYVVREILQQYTIESGIYHICDDESISTNELIELIATSIGKKACIWKLPRPLVSFLAHLGTFLHMPFNKFRLLKLTENYLVSNEKIKKALHISKMPIDAQTALKQTFIYFKSQTR